MNILHGLFGLATMLALAWGLSENRRAIPWRVVCGGVALQLALALVLLKIPLAAAAVRKIAEGVETLQRATDAGTQMVFGYLAGAPAPFAMADPAAGFILAFKALPLAIVVAALAALLFHWGVLQRIVQAFAFVLRSTLGVGGPLGLGAATHIFVGMVEAPLIVKPYLARMSRGELFALMSCGMAGIAGTVMAIYGAALAPRLPDALQHILVASVISTPAALAVAALMVPFAPDPGAAGMVRPDGDSSAMEAIVRGAGDGIAIVVGIVAMLITMVALVHLVDVALGLLPEIGGAPVSLRALFALAFRPLMWAIGIPWPETATAAGLMGLKTSVNEFVAYLDLARTSADALSPRARLIVVYALCGFANFGSLGIMIGAMSAMAPERRADIVALAPRSLVSGTLATCMSGAVIGMM